MVFEEDGEIIEMEEEMLSVTPNEEFSFILRNDFLEGRVEIRFERTEEGTRIITDNEVAGVGILAPLMPLLVSSMEERQLEQYALLKAMIEAEPEAPEGK